MNPDATLKPVVIVRHELMEAFHWEGHRVFNPHNTIGQLASINGVK